MKLAKQKVLVSACLMGINCKYNGKSNFEPDIVAFLKDKEVILVCPEVMGGLSIPRLKSEIKNHQILNEKQEDVTSYFERGANQALAIALREQIDLAILKEKSPSCGLCYRYDGNFSQTLIQQPGIFTQKLLKHQIKVLTENDFKGAKTNEKKIN